jgi:hypothetical protein
MQLRQLLIYCASQVLIIPDSPNRALWKIPEQTPNSKSGETWQEMVVNFAKQNISFLLGSVL